jgi:peptidoglycan/xylan/chitin deacetylase (PgdA/CDA1 family)
MPRKFWREFALASDARLADSCLRIFPAAPTLLIFVFHSLFESEAEIARGLMDPQQAVTTAMFRDLVAELRGQGYGFASPEDVIAGLDPSRRFAMLTFDDGYANNIRALPALEEFQVPAVFFIASNYVLTGKPFWWDVAFREMRQRDLGSVKLAAARARWKSLRTCDAEKEVMAEFGSAAFQTVSEIDRPFTAAELAALARHPLVHIGNHTADHAILTNYSPAEMREQIRGAQAVLEAITGRIPVMMAYPNGNVSKPVLQAAHEAGIRLGVTVRAGRNKIASARSKTGALLLKRYTLWGDRDLGAQCRVARSPLSLQSAWAALRSRADQSSWTS